MMSIEYVNQISILLFASWRIVNLHQQIEPLSLVLRHVDIVLRIVDEERINYFWQLFLFFDFIELVSEVGGELGYLCLCY